MLHNNYTQQDYKSYHVIISANPERGTGDLLLGDLNSATDQILLREHNVRTIITAATGLQHLKIPPEQTHIVFPLVDAKTENIQAYFDLSYQTIDENLKRGAVLVHCGAGISRSATLVIAYYMKKFDTAFISALKYVKKIRSNVCPNLGFELQLKKYQEQLGLGEHKKKEESNSPQQESKKQRIEPKQMNLTFNGPSATKASRMSNTTMKTFVSHTPIVHRKTTTHSSTKKTVSQMNDLFVVGKQAGGELKNESMYEVNNYWPKGGWGVKKTENNSFKL